MAKLTKVERESCRAAIATFLAGSEGARVRQVLDVVRDHMHPIKTVSVNQTRGLLDDMVRDGLLTKESVDGEVRAPRHAPECQPTRVTKVMIYREA